MVEHKIETIGSQRREYLKYANLAMAAMDYRQAQEQIENFLHTIPEEDPEYKEIADKIKNEFDRIERRALQTIKEFCTDTEKMDSWTQTEVRADKLANLTIEKMRDRIDKVWKIALMTGLLND